jgi:Lrp/AsnC family transcriptional regulator, leucine-responsive regulatory protein
MAEIKLDKIDRKLLNLLQTDNQRSTKALADAVHVSQPTLLRRIRTLREAGVIAQDVSVIDPLALGYGMFAFIDISLHDQSDEAASNFEARVLAEPEVLQCYFVTGGFDFFMVLHVANMEAYYHFIRRVLSGSGNVRHFESRFPLKRNKFSTQIVFDEKAAEVTLRKPPKRPRVR